jgi:hypothetical protein
LCDKIARTWLCDADKGAAALKKLAELQLEEVEIFNQLASLVSHVTTTWPKGKTGDEREQHGVKLKKRLLKLVRSSQNQKDSSCSNKKKDAKDAQQLVHAVSQICECLLCTPITGEYTEALLKFLSRSKTERLAVDLKVKEEEEEEEEEEEPSSFGVHCRSFAVHLAHADPGAYRGHLDLLLDMLLLRDEDGNGEEASLTALQLLQITYSSSFNRGEAAALALTCSSSSSSHSTKSLEAVLVRYVHDARKDVSDKAIRVLASVLDGERAKQVLKEQAKKALLKLNNCRNENRETLDMLGEEEDIDIRGGQSVLEATCHALCTLGNLASLSDSLTAEARLQIVKTICSILTEPLPTMDEIHPQFSNKSTTSSQQQQRSRRVSKPNDLFVSAVGCLASVLAPRLESIQVPDSIRRTVPDAMQTVANLLNPLSEFELEKGQGEGEGAQVCLTKDEEAEIRLASARAILQVAKRHDSMISYQTHVDLCLVMQDPSCQVRREFSQQLNQLVQHFQSQSPPQVTKAGKYAAALALSGADPNMENVEMTGSYFCRFIAHSSEIMKRYHAQTKEKQQRNVFWNPEYVFVYIVHLLAHHTDYPRDPEDIEELGLYPAFLPFQQMLQFALECLSYKRPFACDFALLDKIFETCKDSGEALNGSTASMHCIADLAWRLTDQMKMKMNSGRPEDDVSMTMAMGSSNTSLRVPLPKTLYKIGQERKLALQLQGGNANTSRKGSCVPEGLALLTGGILAAALAQGAHGGSGSSQKGRKKPRSRSSARARPKPNANANAKDGDRDYEDGALKDQRGNKKKKRSDHRSEIRAGVKVQSRNQPSRTAKAKAAQQLSYFEESDDKENNNSSILL